MVFKIPTVEFTPGIQNTHSRIYMVFKIPTVEFTGYSKYPPCRNYRVVKVPTLGCHKSNINRIVKNTLTEN